ncbi:MAG: DnaJ domain-containing protein [Nitrospirales bacterium]|nr:J domain-containing protein [Nitrospirales bacterium]
MIVKNFYAILEVHPNATQDEIKHAWRELLQVWHPDRFVHNPVLQKKATEKTKDINEAYEVLGNPLNRQSYDSKRRSHKDFRSKTEKPTQEEKTITECPNPSCRTKLRVAKISEPIKIFCPNCHWSFNFDAERGAKMTFEQGKIYQRLKSKTFYLGRVRVSN